MINLYWLYLIGILVPAFSSKPAAKIVGIKLSREVSRSQIWTWVCKETGCEKVAIRFCGEEPCDENETPVSLPVCQLTCPPGTLWPKPSGKTYISSRLLPVNLNSIYTTTIFNDKAGGAETEKLVKAAGKLFTDQLTKSVTGPKNVLGKNLVITVALTEPEVNKFAQNADESYHLLIDETTDGSINATIAATSFLGGRHGLQTLGQLIVYDPLHRALVMPCKAGIIDKPKYTYRGLLVDTARNFISVGALKRTLDAMAMNKLNTFHWHITDSQSFPFESATFPQFTKYGAYSENKVYSENDIKELVEYAKVRGIRILPEFDAPAHVGEGWQWAEKDVTVCFKAEPWTRYCVEPPCGQLNPTSNKMYEILEGIYKDMSNVFDSDIFHMGGDEVNLNCWNSSQAVLDNMIKMGYERKKEDFLHLWSTFQSRALDILEKVSGQKRKIVLWTSTLTEENTDTYLDNSKYIIQIWTKGDDATIKKLINKRFPIIFSNYDALYFDCGFGAWVGTGNNWCSPYIPWQKVYENDPKKMIEAFDINFEDVKDLVLGGEATLWAEQVDDASIDNRLWPRASAMGERLWTGTGNWTMAESRYLQQRERLIQQGINADTVQPQWCYENQGKCYL